ncbi:unnamed protein product, partial [Didymodactylos carnosus]
LFLDDLLIENTVDDRDEMTEDG